VVVQMQWRADDGVVVAPARLGFFLFFAFFFAVLISG
jgi:hypothetical protein